MATKAFIDKKVKLKLCLRLVSSGLLQDKEVKMTQSGAIFRYLGENRVPPVRRERNLYFIRILTHLMDILNSRGSRFLRIRVILSDSDLTMHCMDCAENRRNKLNEIINICAL